MSRGCKEGLKQVLTIWCPRLGHLDKGNFERLGCQDGVLRVSGGCLESTWELSCTIYLFFISNECRDIASTKMAFFAKNGLFCQKSSILTGSVRGGFFHLR